MVKPIQKFCISVIIVMLIQQCATGESKNMTISSNCSADIHLPYEVQTGSPSSIQTYSIFLPQI